MEVKEEEVSRDNFCRSCKKYYRQFAGGLCPTCGGKLSTYKPHKYYMKDDTHDDVKERGKVINLPEIIDKIHADLRMSNRKMDKLELRYQQIINLFKSFLDIQRKKKGKHKMTMAKVIDYIEKVVDEPTEPNIDLVEEIGNYEDLPNTHT